MPSAAHGQRGPTTSGAAPVAAAHRARAARRRGRGGRAEQHPAGAVAAIGGEDDQHEQQRGGDGPAEAGAKPGSGDAEFAGEQAERREARAAPAMAEAEQPRPGRVPRRPGPRTSRRCGCCRWLQDLPGADERDRLGQAVAERCAAAPRRWPAGCRPRRRARSGPCVRCWSRRASACSRAGRSAATRRRPARPARRRAAACAGKPGPSAASAMILSAGWRRTRPTAAPRTSARRPGPGPGCGRRAARRAAGRARPWCRTRAPAGRPRCG